jgi:hypothetical protein
LHCTEEQPWMLIEKKKNGEKNSNFKEIAAWEQGMQN